MAKTAENQNHNRKCGLVDIFESRPNGSVLTASLAKIRTKAEPLLSRIVSTFPDYTMHDIGHSDAVLEKLDWLIPSSLKHRLNDYEIFFLVASAFLHDIGMVDFPNMIKSELRVDLADDEKLRNYIRQEHHLRSEKFIVDNFKDLALDDVHQATIIGRISRGHRKENLNDSNLYRPDLMYRRDAINTPFLAALLRLGDELDLTFGRTPAIIYDHIEPRDHVGKLEWEKHLSISGVGPSPEDTLTINCNATCRNPRVHRILKTLEVKINKELEDLPNHLHQYREFRRELPRRFTMGIEATGYKPYDFKFTLQEREIVRLLMGEGLYKNRLESLRELLKNAVDACRLRREILRNGGLKYEPEIVFAFNPEGSRLTVSDNGIGMDEEIIARYFTKIGNSFYRSAELDQFEFTPVSELGIGFLSSFMIADKIILETKTDSSNPLVVEIDDVSEFFFVRDGTRRTTGTSVTLFLKGDHYLADIKEAVRRYARHIEFPIVVELHGVRTVVEDVGRTPDIGGLFHMDSKKYAFRSIEVDDPYVEGVVGILQRKDERGGALPLRSYHEVPVEFRRRMKNRRQRAFLSNEGIFVGNPPIDPDWLNPKRIYSDLDIRKRGLDFNVARNDVIHNEKYFELKRRIEKALIRGFEEYLDEVYAKVAKEGIDAFDIWDRFLSFYVHAGKVDLMHRNGELSEIFLAFLKKYSRFKVMSRDGINYMTYDEVLLDGRLVKYVHGTEQYSDEEIMELYLNCLELEDGVLYASPTFGGRLLTRLNLVSEPHVEHVELRWLTDMTLVNDLRVFLPNDWTLARFRRYKTSRFIGFFHRGLLSTEKVLNADNPFIRLLADNQDVIIGDRQVFLKDFFSRLSVLERYDFSDILSLQSQILSWFVDSEVITKDDFRNYVLKEEDFPSRFFGRRR